MTKKHTLSFHKIFSLLLSLSILVAGICLICGCLTIYFTGEHSYSREIVAETFKKIAVPVYICLALTLVSIIWEFISPIVHSKRRSVIDYPAVINKISSKKDLNSADENTLAMIKSEKRKRKTHAVIRACVIVVTSIVFLVYALNSSNFHQSNINESMIKAMMVLIPCLTVSFIYSVFTVYYFNKSYDKELALIKKLSNRDTSEDSPETIAASNKKITITKIVIVVLALSILIYGYFTGGTADVLTKAINICTECIGLG